MNKKRNSLIELYRFIFSMNVVKNHGYFPYQGKLFSPGRISVEFFYVLSGFLLVKSIDKYNNHSYFKGLFLFVRDKLFSMGIPLLIGLIFGACYRVVIGVSAWWDISIWGYLWYVHDMIVVFMFYYTIRRIFKNQKIFILITSLVFAITSILHAIPEFFAWGYYRAFSSISLGILISFIPSLNLKRQYLIWIPLVLCYAFTLRMLLFDFTFVEEEILDLIIYPALIYLTFQLSVYNVVLNYLGALSFGLYAYQNVTRFMSLMGYENVIVSFIIILSLAIISDLIKRIVIWKREKEEVPV